MEDPLVDYAKLRAELTNHIDGLVERLLQKETLLMRELEDTRTGIQWIRSIAAAGQERMESPTISSLVIEMLQSSDSSLSLEDVTRGVKRTITVSDGSVYAALQKLTHKGIVRKLSEGKGYIFVKPVSGTSRIIMDILGHSNTPLTSSEIVREVTENYKGISSSTVYASIHKLHSTKKILRTGDRSQYRYYLPETAEDV